MQVLTKREPLDAWREVVPGCAQHVGARKEQQDSFAFSRFDDAELIASLGFLAVVADGMGGLSRGAEASERAVRAFLAAFRPPGGDTPDKALLRSIECANTAVRGLNKSGTPNTEAGTTLTAAVIYSGHLHWISAGDSRVYLVRGTDIRQLSIDHNAGTELMRAYGAGRMSTVDGPATQMLTSYLGAEHIPQIDRNPFPLPLMPGDRVLVCSDGLYRTLPLQQMLPSYRMPNQDWCEWLIESALDKKSPRQDNLTVAAMEYAPRIGRVAR